MSLAYREFIDNKAYLFHSKNKGLGARDMAQLTVLAEDPGLVPSTHNLTAHNHLEL